MCLRIELHMMCRKVNVSFVSYNVPQVPPILETVTEKFYLSILLQNIFSTQTVEDNVRWLAVLYIKNGIDRYWRKCAPK